MPISAPKQAVLRDTNRLEAADWVLAGLESLASAGIDAVRVETLARKIGITKGSFYWHFKDRAGLLSAMLAYWRDQATLRIIERLERSGLSPLEKLRQLMNLPLHGKRSAQGSALELAIRLWARTDAAAAAAVLEVDRQRLAHMQHLLGEAGVADKAEAEARAFLIYAYMLAEALVPSALSEAGVLACEGVLGMAT